MPPIEYVEKERGERHEAYYASTPMPDPVVPNCISPAWDPCSRTPGGEGRWEQEKRTDYHEWRLSPAMVGKEFLAGIGENKTFTTLKINEQGQFTKGKFNKLVDPKDVNVKHPTTQHDNRWLVLSGGHAGKWVRRVRHVFEGGEKDSPLTFTVAVVQIREGEEDLETGEQLQVSSQALAITSEGAGSVARNAGLRARLRKH